MIKRSFRFLCFFCLMFCLCSCKGCNVFSWARDSRTSKCSYDSSIGIASSEMRRKNYVKAAEYYENAVDKKPGDKDAIMGYASAAISDIFVGTGGDISEKIAECNEHEISNMISQLVSDERVNEVVTKLTDDENMFPKLFEGSNPPTEDSTNLLGAGVYLMRGYRSIPDPDAQKSFLESAMNGDCSDKETGVYIEKYLACVNRTGNNELIKNLVSDLGYLQK